MLQLKQTNKYRLINYKIKPPCTYNINTCMQVSVNVVSNGCGLNNPLRDDRFLVYGQTSKWSLLFSFGDAQILAYEAG